MFWANPYRKDGIFPYPNSTYPVVNTYIGNDGNVTVLPYGIKYLFNSGL